jgi:CRP/FNR family transcriptional regulator
MLVDRNYQPTNLVRPLPEHAKSSLLTGTLKGDAWRAKFFRKDGSWIQTRDEYRHAQIPCETNAKIDELLYLFACEVEWEKCAEPSAGWELISAARDSRNDIRAHARSLLERSEKVRPPEAQLPEVKPQQLKPPQMTLSQVRPQPGKPPVSEIAIPNPDIQKVVTKEERLKTPYNLEIIESCVGCRACKVGFFCRFSPSVLRSLNAVSHHTIMPPSAVLFVEGQTPRGIYVICSGIVKLSTSSKEGKVLILKQAVAGEVLGLSASISGTNYEMTAETACPCQLNFVSRQDLITLLQNQSEAGVHAAEALSREFQGAYRDIHDLLLARSSSGKLARLLLSCAPPVVEQRDERPLRPVMTHEEMAQRIGSSRETVTRLLSELKKKKLIRPAGGSLVIRNRTGLQALTL